MKLLASLLLAAMTAAAHAQSISTSGFTFNPSLLTVPAGATINLSIGGGHTMTQVSEATWNANGSTALPGGFNFGSGSHQLTLSIPGTYFYVCVPHAGMGMKGRIVVEAGTGVEDRSSLGAVAFPNPAGSELFIALAPSARATAVLHDAHGREALREALRANGVLDVGGLPTGTYVLQLLGADGRLIHRQRIAIAR